MLKFALSRTVIVSLLVLAVSGSGRGQHNQPGQMPSPIQTTPNTPQLTPDESAQRAAESKQARARNEDRQRRLVADSDKLLALATSLHEDVAKTDKNVLSLDVIKRADEIERLAHAVKERMRG